MVSAPGSSTTVTTRAALLAFGVVLACDSPFDPRVELRDLSCASHTRGSLHHMPDSSVTMKRAASPHVLLGPVHGTVTVEPGATVCVAPDLTLSPRRLIAIGTVDEPILFIPLDNAGSWNGIHMPWEDGVAELDHVHIRRTTGRGIQLRSGFIRNSVVDSSCMRGPQTNPGPCAAIIVDSYSNSVSIDETTVRWSGGEGIQLLRRSRMRLSGGSIEGSAGVGLVSGGVGSPNEGGLPGIRIDRPVRITGGASYPASVPVTTARALTRDAATTAGILGNAVDTLIVIGYAGWGDAGWDDGGAWVPTEGTVRKELPWRVVTGCGGAGLGTLRLEPGSHLTLAARSPCYTVPVMLHASGSAAEPVHVRGNGAVLLTHASEPATVRHTVFQDVHVLAQGEGPTMFEYVTLKDASIRLLAAGSRIMGSKVGGFAPAFPGNLFAISGIVTLGANTTLVRTRVVDARRRLCSGCRTDPMAGVVATGAGVELDECSISGSTGDGVRIEEQGSATISNCNIESNAGDGVANLAPVIVIATSNWWGDPAGPFGPNGDGVSGPVHYEPFRTLPVNIRADVAWIDPGQSAHLRRR